MYLHTHTSPLLYHHHVVFLPRVSPNSTSLNFPAQVGHWLFFICLFFAYIFTLRLSSIFSIPHHSSPSSLHAHLPITSALHLPCPSRFHLTLLDTSHRYSLVLFFFTFPHNSAVFLSLFSTLQYLFPSDYLSFPLLVISSYYLSLPSLTVPLGLTFPPSLAHNSPGSSPNLPHTCHTLLSFKVRETRPRGILSTSDCTVKEENVLTQDCRINEIHERKLYCHPFRLPTLF